MGKVYLLLGSNLGNRKENLLHASREIHQHIGQIVTFSSYYETSPWGYKSDNLYLNQLLIVKTTLEPHNLLKKVHEIEEKLGRKRYSDQKNYVDRSIDIDILFYDELIIEHPELTIPHPQIPKRRFTLEIICELEPEKKHPKLKKTMVELLDECTDNGLIRKKSFNYLN